MRPVFVAVNCRTVWAKMGTTKIVQAAVTQYAQVDRRMGDAKFVPDEESGADHAEHGHALDEGGGKPVVLLALFQHGLEPTQA
jgi:hypothetical protein